MFWTRLPFESFAKLFFPPPYSQQVQERIISRKKKKNPLFISDMNGTKVTA